MSADDFRQAVVHARQKPGTFERRTNRVIAVARSTVQNKAVPKGHDALRLALTRLAKQYGRHGYRKVGELLSAEGWPVNHKKVEHL